MSCLRSLAESPLQCFHYFILFGFGQPEIQRDADCASVVGFGGREVARLKAEVLAVIRLGVHGNVVHIGADAVLPQEVEHLAACFAAVGAHLRGIEVQGGAVLRVALRQNKRQVGKQAVVSRGQIVAAGEELVDAGHLAHSEGGLQFGHAVVVAEVDLLVIPSAVRLLSHFFGIAGDTVAA